MNRPKLVAAGPKPLIQFGRQGRGHSPPNPQIIAKSGLQKLGLLQVTQSVWAKRKTNNALDWLCARQHEWPDAGRPA